MHHAQKKRETSCNEKKKKIVRYWMFIRKENSYFPSYTVDRHPLNNDNVIFVGKHLEFSPVFFDN